MLTSSLQRAPMNRMVEDDDSADESETISTRTLALTRYRRNHEFMNEVFMYAAFGAHIVFLSSFVHVFDRFGLGDKKAPPPPPPLKPKPKPAAQYVVALYDFAAQADGDLDFKAGDRIEVVERTDSTEDWWTGKLNGRQGVFPGAIAHMRGLSQEIEANGSRVTCRKLCPGGMRHRRC